MNQRSVNQQGLLVGGGPGLQHETQPGVTGHTAITGTGGALEIADRGGAADIDGRGDGAETDLRPRQTVSSCASCRSGGGGFSESARDMFGTANGETSVVAS